MAIFLSLSNSCLPHWVCTARFWQGVAPGRNFCSFLLSDRGTCPWLSPPGAVGDFGITGIRKGKWSSQQQLEMERGVRIRGRPPGQCKRVRRCSRLCSWRFPAAEGQKSTRSPWRSRGMTKGSCDPLGCLGSLCDPLGCLCWSWILAGSCGAPERGGGEERGEERAAETANDGLTAAPAPHPLCLCWGAGREQGIN